MANSYSGNIIRVDTSAAFSYATSIQSIRYVGTNASASCILYSNAVSTGSQLFEAASAAGIWFDSVDIRDNNGVYVSVTNGAVIYVHLKAE